LQVTAGDSSSPAISRLTATEEAAQRLQKVLAELGSPESVKYAGKEPIVDDDDSWMEMTPGQLDQLLQAYQAQTAAAAAAADGNMGDKIGTDDDVRDTRVSDDEDNVQRGLQDLVSKMGSFVKGTSGLEGVEGGLGDDAALGGEGEVDFDSDTFVQALQQMLSTFGGQERGAAEDDNEGEKDDEDDEDDEEDEEDEGAMDLSNSTERGETQPRQAGRGGAGSHRQAMRAAMDEQLEEELRNTHVQSGFEKVCLHWVKNCCTCVPLSV
jgi:hypothetical protein